MNAEQIRAEAIRAIADELEVGELPQVAHNLAEAAVDALAAAGLLPTAMEVSSCFPDEPAADDEAMRRYVTDWREMAE